MHSFGKKAGVIGLGVLIMLGGTLLGSGGKLTSVLGRQIEGMTVLEISSPNKEEKPQEIEDVFPKEYELTADRYVIQRDTTDIQEFVNPSWIPMIEEICKPYNISPELVEAIIERESGGNPNASSGWGDEGSMQVVVSIHRDRMKKLGVTNIYDPYGGVLVGVDVLNAFRDQYGDDLYEVLGRYNGQSAAAEGVPNEYAVSVIARAEELTKKHDNERGLL